MATYYFDTYLPSRFAEMLRALGVSARHALDPQSIGLDGAVADEEWLAQIQLDQGVLITIDRVSKKSASAALALHASGVTAIFLPSVFEKWDKWGQAGWLIRHWQNIEDHTANIAPGSWALMTKGGEIVGLTPPASGKG